MVKKLSDFASVPPSQAGIVIPVVVGGANRTVNLTDLFTAFSELISSGGGQQGVKNKGTYTADGVSLLAIGTDDGPIRNTTQAYSAVTTTTLGSVVNYLFADGVTAPAYRFGKIAANQVTGFHIPYDSAVPFDVSFEAESDAEHYADYLFVTTDPTARNFAYDASKHFFNALATPPNTLIKASFTVPAGKGDLFFRFSKDGSGSRATDTIYIRKLSVDLPQLAVSYSNGDVVSYEGKLYIYGGAQPTAQSPAENAGWLPLGGTGNEEEGTPAPTYAGIKNRGPWNAGSTYANGSIVGYSAANYLWVGDDGGNATPGADARWFPL